MNVKSLRKLISGIRFFLINYLVSTGIGLLFCLLEALGRIKYVHFDRFPIWEEKLIIVSNHPSLLDPILLPLMGFPWMNYPWVFSSHWRRIRFSLGWLRRMQKEFALSKKLIPANVPDRQNFFDYGLWRMFQGINVPVDRNGGPRNRMSTIYRLKDVLDKGGRVLIFPEGGRTYKAVKKDRLKSPGGKEMGALKNGAGWLAMKTGAKILPVWVEGTDRVLPNDRLPFPRLWRRIIIKIGTPVEANGHKPDEVTAEIARALLSLAEENETAVKKPPVRRSGQVTGG